jgi:hypothetical protein
MTGSPSFTDAAVPNSIGRALIGDIARRSP